MIRPQQADRSMCLLEILEARTLLSTTYYVDDVQTNGNGSSSLPYNSIQAAANVAVAGDTVIIRAGVYRETVVPAHSGTSASPITYRAAPGADVVISGLDPVTGWTQHSGAIYKTAAMGWDLGRGANQVFVNGVPQVEARWPNVPVGEVMHDKSRWATVDTAVRSSDVGPLRPWTITDAGLPYDAAALTGSTLHVIGGNDYTWQTGLVGPASSGATVKTNLNSGIFHEAYAPDHFYFLDGHYDLLDVGGEWYKAAYEAPVNFDFSSLTSDTAAFDDKPSGAWTIGSVTLSATSASGDFNISGSPASLAIKGGASNSRINSGQAFSFSFDTTGVLSSIRLDEASADDTFSLTTPHNGTIEFGVNDALDIELAFSASDIFTLTATGGAFRIGNITVNPMAPDSGTLYLQTHDGTDPDQFDVEVKRRDLGLDLSGRSHIVIEDVDFFATRIATDNASQNLTLRRISADFNSHQTYASAVFDPKNLGRTNTGLELFGSGHALVDSRISFSSGNGITVGGNDHLIHNNIIEDSNYAGSYANAVEVDAGEQITITHNTIRRGGRDLIGGGMTNSEVGFNDLSRALMLTADGAAYYAFGSDGDGTRIHHNTIHDIYGFNDSSQFDLAIGIYLDGGARDYVVDRNITWNMGAYGMLVNVRDYPGQNTSDVIIVNNTFIGGRNGLRVQNAPATITPQEPVSATGMRIVNNLALSEGGSNDGMIYDPASWPAGSVGASEEANNFGPPNQGNPMINGNRYSTEPATLGFVDHLAGDVRLTGTSADYVLAIDRGGIYSPFTDGYTGALPDRGAIEFGDALFETGATPVEPPAPAQLVEFDFTTAAAAAMLDERDPASWEVDGLTLAIDVTVGGLLNVEPDSAGGLGVRGGTQQRRIDSGEQVTFSFNAPGVLRAIMLAGEQGTASFSLSKPGMAPITFTGDQPELAIALQAGDLLTLTHVSGAFRIQSLAFDTAAIIETVSLDFIEGQPAGDAIDGAAAGSFSQGGLTVSLATINGETFATTGLGLGIRGTNHRRIDPGEGFDIAFNTNGSIKNLMLEVQSVGSFTIENLLTGAVVTLTASSTGENHLLGGVGFAPGDSIRITSDGAIARVKQLNLEYFE
jgi:hypothetical protein